MEYKDKLKTCDRECAFAILGLILTVCVWLICGIGFSASDVIIFSTPLWIVAGLVGTFLFACIFSIVFAFVIMKDVSLEEETEIDG